MSNSAQGCAARSEMYPVPEGAQAPGSWELGCRAPGSNQVGMTQPVTPTESFPLSSLPASVSSGRVGGWEQVWQGPAGPPDSPDASLLPALPSPALPCPTRDAQHPGALGTVFPGNLAVKPRGLIAIA